MTGLVSFTVGVPEGWPLFWLHRALGIGIVALLAWKLARVGRRLTDPSLWRRSTALSVLTLVAALGTLATRIVWVFGLDVRLSYWTLLSVHVGFGLALVPLVAAHAATRFRLPRRVDFERRRTAIRYTVLLAAGAATYRLQQAANDALDTAGSDRRFTGSQPREGEGNGAFPITSWVADDPDPIDREPYRLMVDGLVVDPIALNASDLAAGHETEALLDCTSGWYTVQEWGGIRVGDLLDAAGGVAAAGKPRCGFRPRAGIRPVHVRDGLPLEPPDRGGRGRAARNARGRRAPLARARRARSAGRARQAGVPVGEVGDAGGSQVGVRPRPVGGDAGERVRVAGSLAETRALLVLAPDDFTDALGGHRADPVDLQ